jgi:hypothetical protein
MQRRLHGAGWPAEGVGDLGFAEVLPIAQGDDGTLPCRQTGDGVSRLIDVRNVGDRWALRSMQCSGTTATQDLDARVHDRALQVADRVLDVPESSMQSGERVLYYFFGERGVQRDRGRQTSKANTMLTIELIETQRLNLVSARWFDGART